MSGDVAAILAAEGVRVFEFVGGGWKHQQTLRVDDELGRGSTLAVSENYLVVGAERGALLYARLTDGSWQRQDNLVIKPVFASSIGRSHLCFIHGDSILLGGEDRVMSGAGGTASYWSVFEVTRNE